MSLPIIVVGQTVATLSRASSRMAFHNCRSKLGQPMKPNHFRVKPGGRCVAIHAASMGNVPEPHMKSTSGTSPNQPVESSNPAASASFNGARVSAGR